MRNLLVAKKWSVIALLLSLILGLVALNFAGRSLGAFYDYQRAVSPDMELTVDRFHFFLRKEIELAYQKLTATAPIPDASSSLPTFHISVDPTDLQGLEASLPLSGKDHFIDGWMKVSDEERSRNIKLRYRGDNNFHWLYGQKSMRIKLPSGELYNMERQFNLINHPNWYFHRDVIAYELSKEMGLIVPDYYPVRVFLNGEFKGVYIYLSQVDESLLRKRKVMPGSIYSGDGAPADETGFRNLWANEEYWDKKSARNAEQAANREDIAFFVKAPYIEDDAEFYEVFTTQFDQEKYFSFIAIDRLVGSGHHDYHHNHKFYFDPYKGMCEPIQWDVRIWSRLKKKDLSLYPLVLKIKSNPILDAEIDKRVYKLIQGGIESSIADRMDAIHDQVESDLHSDYLKDNALLGLFRTWISVPFSMDEYSRWMEEDKALIGDRIAILESLYASTAVQYSVERIEDEKYLLSLKIDGHAPAVLDFGSEVRMVKPIDWNLEGPVLNRLRLYPGRKLNKNVKPPTLQGRYEVVNVPQYYQVLVETADASAIDRLKATNYVTGAPVALSRQSFPLSYDENVMHPKNLVYPKITDIELSGEISLDTTRVFDRYTNVTILPGTTFVLGEGVSVYFYGKVLARGTQESPIKFMPRDVNKPWGLVAVQGKATSGSVFEYVEIESGSVDSRNMIHYTAPFNIHDTDWFEVRHCKIGQNFVGDDAMHVAYAKGIIDACEFYDARSDALDIDIADVQVTNSVFFNSGNDALDVMTTTMVAENNIFMDTGDKGISVGEWSDVEVRDSLFVRTFIGLEIKDKSRVRAENLIFIDSEEKAINLYNKNIRYDEGGHLSAKKLSFYGNDVIEADARSSYSLDGTTEGEMPGLDSFGWYLNLPNKAYKRLIDQAWEDHGL